MDAGRFNGAPASSQGRPIGFQASFAEEYGAVTGEEAFNGYPSSKPPTFPPPSPPGVNAGLGSSDWSDFPALGMSRQAASGSGRPASAGTDLSRVLHGQTPQSLLSRNMSEASEEGAKKEEMLYLTTPEAERAAREKYGLLGILKVIRMTDPDLNTLALGMDLTNLGLNLNSPECLYATFASPWSDAPARKDPEFYLPPCYYMNPPQLKTAHLQKFSWETLFYIFFNMPRDTLQAYAAAELYNRGWKYHRELKMWFILQEEEGQAGHPRWVCFDSTAWEKHYYHQPVDVPGFLTEEDVRVKLAVPGSTGSIG